MCEKVSFPMHGHNCVTIFAEKISPVTYNLIQPKECVLLKKQHLTHEMPPKIC